MEPTKTIHPAMERVYAVATRLGLIGPVLRQSAFARLLNTSSQAVKNWEDRGPSKDIRLTLQSRFGINASWIESGEGDDLLPSPNGESAENPSDPVHVQPAKKAMESGAPLVLSPAVHALIETARPLPDDDLALLTQIARRMARGGIGEKTRKLIESDGQDAGLEGLLSTQAITRNKKKTPI